MKCVSINVPVNDEMNVIDLLFSVVKFHLQYAVL